MKRALIALDLLTLCILTGCASPTLRVFAFGALKPPTEIAMNVWQDGFDRGPPSCRVDLYWSPDADVFVMFGDPKGTRRAEHRDDRIIVRPSVPTEELPMVIAHELGHALGMTGDRHATNPEELMYGKQPGRTEPEPDGWDVAWVCEAR